MLLLLSACSTVRQEALPGSGYATASWYGPKFNGRPTSSGEIFNMYAMTCAHKEYPFGTRLRVTNVANSKAALCTVNDRGPFVDGRDIDLSYAVAREIGLIGPGTGRVFLEVEGRDASYIRKPKVESSGQAGPFAIQVGSFAESINAVRLKVALRLKYGNVYIQEADLKGGTHYRVRIGNFDTLRGALSTADRLGEEGYSAIVLKADIRM
ncbi:MAG: septal ring lytic transglycosylase RlpA family protein [Nitrospiraceae bacterium]|nr:septal ring lytic transglycosylase RlpA family protein [Nitrospiraceae bacterium]